MSVELVAGHARLTVSPDDGGRWTSLHLFGEELLGGAEIASAYPPILHGCFVMAPYAGRVGNAALEWDSRRVALEAHDPPHAIHGTVLDRPWKVVSKGPASVELAVELPGPPPLVGRVRQRLLLSDTALDARIELHAAEDMPATLGIHPWFRRELSRGAEAEVRMAPVSQYERGADRLPTGRLVAPGPGPHDDCFILHGEPVIRWPGTLTLTMRSSHDHWVVFDELPEVLCLEPQTGPPNAVQLGRAAAVSPGQPLTLEVQLRWQREFRSLRS